LGRGWRPKREVVRCASPEECLKACLEGKILVVEAEDLLKIADKLPRGCAAMVEARRLGAA